MNQVIRHGPFYFPAFVFKRKPNSETSNLFKLKTVPKDQKDPPPCGEPSSSQVNQHRPSAGDAVRKITKDTDLDLGEISNAYHKYLGFGSQSKVTHIFPRRPLIDE